MVVLSNSYCLNIEGFELSQKIETEVNTKIQETNEELEKAGKSILQVAKLLAQVKNLVKNKNWVTLTDSGALVLPGRVARDLASAYENWLVNSSVPEVALTQVSARTLARIGKVEDSLRLEIEKHLKEEKKYTESELSSFLRNSAKTIKPIDELIKQAEFSIQKLTDEEKLERFPNLYFKNIQLKKKIKELEAKVLNFRRKLNNA